jgi:hypothetical protein
MKKIVIFLVAALAATPAIAGPVATPALKPPTGGQLHCLVANISATETMKVSWTIYSYDGTVMFGPIESTLGPHTNTYSGNSVTAQSTCVAKVLAGTRANLRVTLVANDSAGNVVTSVQGY